MSKIVRNEGKGVGRGWLEKKNKLMGLSVEGGGPMTLSDVYHSTEISFITLGLNLDSRILPHNT